MADVIGIRDRSGDFYRRRRNTVKRVLNQARGLTEVLVIGFNGDGEIHVRGCPNDPGQAMWLMELAKQRLLNGGG
jgi:hypothetical protein